MEQDSRDRASGNQAGESPAGANPVAANLAAITARVAAAARRANRDAAAITLVAVSKTRPVAEILPVALAGQRHFGENRVQEAGEKFPALRERFPDLVLHLIGGLQTNKAREAVRIADVIESLDRPHLADALAAAIAHEHRTPRLLVQVNVGDEPQKSGVARAEADRFIEDCKARFGTALVGLMCVPPLASDPAAHFQWLAALAARHELSVLSMGMSADFETAIAHGATEVRVGTAIFGARPKKQGAFPAPSPG